jgi:hypothetical protein
MARHLGVLAQLLDSSKRCRTALPVAPVVSGGETRASRRREEEQRSAMEDA